MAMRCRAVCTCCVFRYNIRTVHAAPPIPTTRALATLDMSNSRISDDLQTSLKDICNSKGIDLQL